MGRGAVARRRSASGKSSRNDVSPKRRSPFILALESLAVGAGGDWSEDESHFVVIVAECAKELLARLADAGLYAPNEPSNGGLRLGTAGSEAEAEGRHPGTQTNASGKDSPAADATAAERKAKALARQKAAMAQMAARQAAFALAATDDDDVESDFDGDANVAGSNPDIDADRLPWDEKGVCGLCRGSEAHSNDDGDGFE